MGERRNVWKSPVTWIWLGAFAVLMIVVVAVEGNRSPYSAACTRAYHSYERFQNSLPDYARTVNQGDAYGLSQSDYCEAQHIR